MIIDAMIDNKTIAAISTAQGEGGVGVIRISGSDSAIIADRVFKNINSKKLVDMKGYTAAYGKIIYNNEELDEAVALVFKAPHSYTGEDVVELSCHGGVYITKQVLRAVLDAGAVPAQAGEFTKRAFLNDPDVFFLRDDNISLTDAEKDIHAKVLAQYGSFFLTSDNMGDYGEDQTARYKEYRRIWNAKDWHDTEFIDLL